MQLLLPVSRLPYRCVAAILLQDVILVSKSLTQRGGSADAYSRGTSTNLSSGKVMLFNFTGFAGKGGNASCWSKEPRGICVASRGLPLVVVLQHAALKWQVIRIRM